jgi:hypothetical protein
MGSLFFAIFINFDPCFISPFAILIEKDESVFKRRKLGIGNQKTMGRFP